MTGALRRLRNDVVARVVVERARRRDQRYGSGDTFDFALFVVDETRKEIRAAAHRLSVKP